jgi:DNA-binding NarL/FixJ family response regulator
MESSPKVIVYLPTPGGATEALLQVCEEHFPFNTVETVRSLDELVTRFQQPHDDIFAAVLMPPDRKGLLLIDALREHFGDTRLILVLPDRDDLTLTTAHRLRPRFLTYANADLREVGAVLKKMLDSAGRT